MRAAGGGHARRQFNPLILLQPNLLTLGSPLSRPRTAVLRPTPQVAPLPRLTMGHVRQSVGGRPHRRSGFSREEALHQTDPVLIPIHTSVKCQRSWSPWWCQRAQTPPPMSTSLAVAYTIRGSRAASRPAKVCVKGQRGTGRCRKMGGKEVAVLSYWRTPVCDITLRRIPSPEPAAAIPVSPMAA